MLSSENANHVGGGSYILSLDSQVLYNIQTFSDLTGGLSFHNQL